MVIKNTNYTKQEIERILEAANDIGLTVSQEKLLEISDKIFLRLSDGCPDGLFLDNTHDQIVGQAEEEVFNLFTVKS